MNAETVLLPRKKEARIRRAEALRHALAGLLLVLSSLDNMPSGRGEGALASWLGLAAGLILFIAAARELKPKAGHAAGRFNWVDLFAAAATCAEGFHLHHLGKHYLPYPYYTIAAVYLALGFLRGPLIRLRRLDVDGEGFSLRASLFKPRRARWADLTSLEVEGEAVTWTAREDGKMRVDLSRSKNAAQAQAALLRWAAIRIPAQPAPEAGDEAPV